MTRARVLLLVQQLRRAASGGIGTYALGLLQGLRELEPGGAPQLELLASRYRRHAGDRSDPLVGLGPRLRTSVLPGPVMTRAWDHGIVRAPAGFDVVHAVSLATLEPGRAALVTTIHDLLWRRVPDAYPPRGRAWHEAALRRALRRSDRFIVPSAPVAEDLQDAGAPGEAITVVPMGCDHLPAPDLESAAALLGRIGVTGPFLLSVATLEPRKNLVRLIEAYRQVRDSLPEPWPLVMVGPPGWGERLEQAPGVVFTGRVRPAELSALYATTRLLAYVPVIEGFGLPPVEAMAFGAPVVASPLPSTGGAALEVDPNDVASIADGIRSVAVDEAVRSRLQDAGARRAAELRWSEIARSHVAVWGSAQEAHRGHG